MSICLRHLDPRDQRMHLAARLNQRIQADLIQKLKEIILPNTPFEIEMQWSGIMAFSDTKLPLIKNISKNIIYAMNCNGMGVSLSPITAKEIVLNFII